MSYQDDVDGLQRAGFSGDEIQSWSAKQGAEMLQAGFSPDEVQHYQGAPQLDENQVTDLVKTNLGDQKPLDFTQALEAGLQISTAGLAIRGKNPDLMMTGKESFAAHTAGSLAQLAGDVPAMITGFGIGTAAGAETGPGALATGTAGAFALPTALRTVMMDAYSKGGFKNFQDFWDRLLPVASETAKSYITGAATGVAGAAAPAAIPEATEATKSIASVGAQYLTFTNVGAWLNGKLATAQDYADGAIAMLGLKGAMEGSAALRNVFAKTGVAPEQVYADSQSDPTIKQDLAATNIDIPKAYEHLQEKAPEEQVKPEAPELKLKSEDDAQSKLLSKISVGESKGKSLPTWDQVYAATVDRFNPIKEVVDAMNAGDDSKAIDNSYKLTRNNAIGSMTRAQQFLESGTFDAADISKTTGLSFKDIIKPFKGEDLDGLRAAMVAPRIVELEGRGIKSGFDLDAAKQVLKDNGGKYDNAMKQIDDYQTSTLKYLKDKGVLSQDGFDAIKEKNKNYIPFYRLMDEEKGGVGFQTRNPVKAIKGSERGIIDPLESIIRNTYAYIKLADRNEAVKSFVDLAEKQENPAEYFEASSPSFKPTKVSETEMSKFLEKNGIDDIPDDALTVFRATRGKLDKDEVGYFDKGEYKVIKVDPDLAEAFNGTPRAMHGLLFNLLRFPAKMLRLGFVTPEFIARHLVRNQISGSVLGDSKTGYVPLVGVMENIANTFRGIGDYLGRSEDYDNAMRAGAVTAAPSGIDRNAMQDEINRLTGGSDKTIPGVMWNVIKSPFDLLHAIQQSLEAATRIGSYKQAMKGLDVNNENMLDAATYARNIYPDPSRMGNATATWNAITALFNIEIQHTDQVAGAIIAKAVPTMAKLFAGITIPTIALWYYRHEEEKKWDAEHPGEEGTGPLSQVPQWQRDFTWSIPIGGHILSIPKPFLMGEVFGSIPERILDKIYGKDNDNRGLEHLAHDLVEWGVPNMVPSALSPILENITNYNFFKGRPLVPDHLMQELPEYRYTQYTSELTKALSHIIGYVPYAGIPPEVPSTPDNPTTRISKVPPIMLDNYISKWSGGMGVYAMNAADAALRKAGILPDPPLPAKTLSDIPFVKAFTVRYPSSTSDSIQQFQDDYHQLSETIKSYNALMQQGDPDAAQLVLNSNPAAQMKLDDINQMLIDQNKIVRDLYKNPDINPDEKRQLIDGAYLTMIQATKLGNDLMDEVKQDFRQPLSQTVH